jgi:hypothetical protein
MHALASHATETPPTVTTSGLFLIFPDGAGALIEAV